MPKLKVETLLVRDGETIKHGPDTRVINVDPGTGLDVYITFATTLAENGSAFFDGPEVVRG